MTCRVLLADDHALVREGVKNVLAKEGFEIAGEASDGRRAVALAKTLHPDVALLDISMPSLNGIDAARQIRLVSPPTRVVLLTMYKEEAFVFEALRAGVRGYVLKTQEAADLIEAIRSVLNGEIYLSPGISDGVVRAALLGAKFVNPLTAREREILQLIAEGKTNKEISQQLGKSVKTVESHRTKLMAKLDIHESAGLVRHAVKIGLIHV